MKISATAHFADYTISGLVERNPYYSVRNTEEFFSPDEEPYSLYNVEMTWEDSRGMTWPIDEDYLTELLGKKGATAILEILHERLVEAAAAKQHEPDPEFQHA